jgi:hypothetical protein
MARFWRRGGENPRPFVPWASGTGRATQPARMVTIQATAQEGRRSKDLRYTTVRENAKRREGAERPRGTRRQSWRVAPGYSEKQRRCFSGGAARMEASAGWRAVA